MTGHEADGEVTDSASAKRHILTGLVLAFVVLALDQLIKWLVETNLPFHKPVEVLPFFSLFYTFNTGIAFSFMNTLSPTALVAIAAIVVLIMVVLWWQARFEGLLPSLGYGAILGGAIGNIIDRVIHGYVIDYVLLHTAGYSFAIFNLADAALTVGVGIILLASFIGGSKTKPEEPA